jgi:hypothetical protein
MWGAAREGQVIQVYIAAPFKRHAEAARMRARLAEVGHDSTARWIDQAAASSGVDALTLDSATQAIRQNDADEGAADVVLALYFHKEGCEMFGEVARALEWGIPVVMLLVDGEHEPLASFREGVVATTDEDAAVRLVKWATRGMVRP